MRLPPVNLTSGHPAHMPAAARSFASSACSHRCTMENLRKTSGKLLNHQGTPVSYTHLRAHETGAYL
eukprot:6471481-Pyramimonas_sp.AAC.1